MYLHIVEDVESVCKLLIEIANHYNLKVQAFPSPAAYLDYLEGGDYVPPALAVISDVDMPRMSGFEMMGRVRSIYPLPNPKIAVPSNWAGRLPIVPPRSAADVPPDRRHRAANQLAGDSPVPSAGCPDRCLV